MLKRLNHVGIAVHSLDEAIELYRQTFGVEQWERMALPERHMEVAICTIGETLLELIAPTSEQAAFAGYLRERGPGMHHLAYEVDDVDDALARLAAGGVRLVDQQARPGIHNTRVAFLHPKATMGVLIELVELPKG
jgi:methylmalonyl-CoA/ethylmalonyl-CoA epimerase